MPGVRQRTEERLTHHAEQDSSTRDTSLSMGPATGGWRGRSGSVCPGGVLADDTLDEAVEGQQGKSLALPYQWFGFYADGALTSMASTEPATHSEDELRKTFNVVKASAPRFSWHQGMLVVRYADSPSSTEYWGVNLVTSDLELSIAPPLKPGDLIMTLAGGEDGDPVYYRLLRRVK